MFLKSRISTFFIAAIFSLALLLPIVTQTIHALDGHKHEVCNDFSAHLHKKQLDCSICDFHFSIFDFKIQSSPEFISFSTFHKLESIALLPEASTLVLHYYLRGPPLLS